MRGLPTDLKILKNIYAEYYDAFASCAEGDDSRTSKIYVPIDIEKVARRLKMDPEILFGRLYYHLDKKYGYKSDDGVRVPFFSQQVGGDRHCVHFPYLAAVLASMKDENRKFLIATSISIVALFLSFVSIYLAS